MCSIKIITFLFLGGLLAPNAFAETPVPCPSGSTFGCFEVGLPGSSKLAAGKSIDGFVGGKDTEPILEFIGVAVNVVIAALVIIGVISIVIGGYMYMTAGGDGGRVKMAKEMIVAALVGIFLSLISVVILNTINKYLGTSAQEPVLGKTGTGSSRTGTDTGGSGGGGGTGGAGIGGGAGNGSGSGNNVVQGGGNTLPVNSANPTSQLVTQLGFANPQNPPIGANDIVLVDASHVIFRGTNYDLGDVVNPSNIYDLQNYQARGLVDLKTALGNAHTNGLRDFNILSTRTADLAVYQRLNYTLTNSSQLGIPLEYITPRDNILFIK